jgi:hypothetical protein
MVLDGLWEDNDHFGVFIGKHPNKKHEQLEQKFDWPLKII